MYLPYNYTNAFFMPGLSYLRILKTRKIPLAPLMRVSRPSSACPIIQVRPHCVTAPYHVPRPLHYEYTRQPPIQHLLIGPGQSLSVSTAPPPLPLLPQGLDLAFYRSPLVIDEDVETMDVESSTVDVLTSGTDTDVDMHDRAAQPSSASIVDVETEDLDTMPDILLDEITAGIAALSLTDNNEDHEIDLLAERMSALSIDDDAGDAMLNMAVEASLTTPVQSSLPAVQPEPVAGPDVLRYSNVSTFKDDMHFFAQSTAMVFLDESGPDNGPTTSQDADELPPTPTLTLSGGTRYDMPYVEATGTECALQVNLEALAPVHEVFPLTGDVESLGLDASTEGTLRDDEADEHDSPSECVPPLLSIEDENWDDLKPMQMLVPKEEGRDASETRSVKNPIDEDDENLFWNGPSLGTLEGDGHQTTTVDLQQYWSDEEELKLRNIVFLRCGAAPVFSLDEEDSEDEDCSRPSSPTPCNYNVEWRLPFARKRVRSECEDSDEDEDSPLSSPCAQRYARRGDLRNGKRIRLSEESSVSMEKDACARRRAPRTTRSLRSQMRRGRR